MGERPTVVSAGEKAENSILPNFGAGRHKISSVGYLLLCKPHPSQAGEAGVMSACKGGGSHAVVASAGRIT